MSTTQSRAPAAIEARGRSPLLPLRLLANRSRTGANLAMLCAGAAAATIRIRRAGLAGVNPI